MHVPPHPYGPSNRSPIARLALTVIARRFRCSGASWRRWHRWHSAARLSAALFCGSWSRWHVDRNTRVRRIGRMVECGGRRRRCRLPCPQRQVPASSSHHRPSPRCRTSRPCGRRMRLPRLVRRLETSPPNKGSSRDPNGDRRLDSRSIESLLARRSAGPAACRRQRNALAESG